MLGCPPRLVHSRFTRSVILHSLCDSSALYYLIPAQWNYWGSCGCVKLAHTSYSFLSAPRWWPVPAPVLIMPSHTVFLFEFFMLFSQTQQTKGASSSESGYKDHVRLLSIIRVITNYPEEPRVLHQMVSSPHTGRLLNPVLPLWVGARAEFIIPSTCWLVCFSTGWWAPVEPLHMFSMIPAKLSHFMNVWWVFRCESDC